MDTLQSKLQAAHTEPQEDQSDNASSSDSGNDGEWQHINSDLASSIWQHGGFFSLRGISCTSKGLNMRFAEARIQEEKQIEFIHNTLR